MAPEPTRYNETRLEGKRSFELRADGVFVKRALVMGNSFETLVPYKQIVPNVTIIHQRHQLFWYSVIGCPLFDSHISVFSI